MQNVKHEHVDLFIDVLSGVDIKLRENKHYFLNQLGFHCKHKKINFMHEQIGNKIKITMQKDDYLFGYEIDDRDLKQDDYLKEALCNIKKRFDYCFNKHQQNE